MTERPYPVAEEQRPARIERIAGEALRGSKKFNALSEIVQSVNIGALVRIGLIVDEECRGTWNSKSPFAVLDELRLADPQFVQGSINVIENNLGEHIF